MWTVGDDIAWIKPDANGRLRAINPEAGFFGVAPGTSVKTNPNAMATLAHEHDLHQRRADAGRRRVVGRHDRRAAGRVHGLAGQPLDSADRQGNRRQGGASQLALHRAGVAMSDHRSGLGRSRRRADQRHHLRRPPRDHHAAGLPGVQLERAASTPAPPWARRRPPPPPGRSGKVRRDPMAMLPFCGYHMGDYFRHWIKMQRSLSETPRIFHVNWFRKDADGKFLWPGFSENMRVLKWIVDRAHGRALAPRNAHRLDAALRGHRVGRPAFFTQGAVRRAAGLRPRRLAQGSDGARRAVHRTCTIICRRR